MRFRLNFSSLAVFALMALLAGVSPAFAASDNVTVTVNISQVSEITVLPTSLSWTAGNLGSITPGTDSSTQIIIIKNTGSVNVTNVYLNASTIGDEGSNPLGVANAAVFSSAGFIFVRNNTDTSYYHAGRLEWNVSAILASETLSLAGATANFGHGWYKNASGNDWLWKIENGTNGTCNNTGTTFTIKTTPENSSSLSRDFSVSGTNENCGSATAGTNWGTFACTAGPLNGYCVAAYSDCTKIYLYRYNKDSALPACTNSKFLQEATLLPSAETSITVFASVPKGTPAGTAKQGLLTIIAT